MAASPGEARLSLYGAFQQCWSADGWRYGMLNKPRLRCSGEVLSMTASMSAYLSEGADNQPSDAHVRSGYPIWMLMSVWYARGQSDAAVIAEYQIEPVEWEAAKAYYFAHKADIDARRLRNEEIRPLPPGAITIEELLARYSRDETQA
jgi:hypothetical protein